MALVLAIWLRRRVRSRRTSVPQEEAPTPSQSTAREDSEVQEYIDQGNEIFRDFLDRMGDLMRRAREVEFRIRLAAEADAHRAMADERDFEEFSASNFVYPRKKLHKHVDDVLPNSEKRRILLTQELANLLAHADYRPARTKVEQYEQEFGLQSTLSQAPAGLHYFKNLVDEMGQNIDIGYLLESDEQNLILEEFHVFDRQGYVAASREILATAVDILDTQRNLGLTYHMVMIQRGLRRGKRIEKARGNAGS